MKDRSALHNWFTHRRSGRHAAGFTVLVSAIIASAFGVHSLATADAVAHTAESLIQIPEVSHIPAPQLLQANIDAEAQASDGMPSASLKVNNAPIAVPKNGTVHKVVNGNGSKTTVDVSVGTNTQGQSSSTSTLNIQMHSTSESETDTNTE